MTCDVLLCGTGSFAARIAFDLAATARQPVRVVLTGRNRDRLGWLVTASNARARIFGAAARFSGVPSDLLAAGEPERLVARYNPRIVVQAASVQTSSVIARSGDAWSQLVRDGGLSATALAQAAISLKMAQAITADGNRSLFVNCSFPDVVNGMIEAAGHRVLCGFGNVGILASVFAGLRDLAPERLRMLAHYQNLAPFRQASGTRTGRPPRVWMDGAEIADVHDVFREVRLTPEPVIDISGATGVPVITAIVEGREWRGHLPGPNGLPGGYPVRLRDGTMALDLPDGLSEQEAVQWNLSFEQNNGLVVSQTGDVRFNGRLAECLRAHDSALANGFHMRDFDAAFTAMTQLRAQLEART
jgi:hypothetical protein